ncbi:MAG: cache domain-containing protein [Planctomycetota bacterium]|nr:cache domain-containing protein [Planctomycetota bacterium]
MRFSLRTKLIGGFILVIGITGVITTMVGVHLLSSGIEREAQNKVTLDLNVAREIYKQKLKNIETTLRFTALRKRTIGEGLYTKNRELLKGALSEVLQESGLDILMAIDSEGKVIYRAHNPDSFGDNMSDEEIVSKVLTHRKPILGTQIVPAERLQKESKKIAEKARIEIISTPMAKPTERTESTSGMMLKAAVPVFDDKGAFIGILCGGTLLNRNYEIVDEIKETVYKGVKYKGKEIGTSTIFQDDLRISTNVRTDKGERAIGTRIQAEVYDKVIGKGETWTDRAFVVNDWYLTAYEPIRDVDGKVIGILYVGMLARKYDDMKSSAFWTFTGMTLIGILIAFGVAYILAAPLVKPIWRLKRGVEAIAKGDFDFEVKPETRDEIGVLAESFNKVRLELKAMYEKLKGKIEAADEDLKRAYQELREKQEQLVQAEKLASMGQLSAGIAHELNNPLGTVLLYSHMLIEQLKDNKQVKSDLEMIVNEAMRCKQIVRGLLDFARQTRVSKAPVSLSEIVNEVLAIMAPRAEPKKCSLKSDVPDSLPTLMLDAPQIKQVLINLVQNGIDSISGTNGEVTISVREKEGGTKVEVRVTDNGCGIDKETLAKLFTPFFTTKKEGTGLGLAIAYGVVKMHSGDISVSSEVGKGTTFTITLPVEKEEGIGVDSQVKANA